MGATLATRSWWRRGSGAGSASTLPAR